MWKRIVALATLLLTHSATAIYEDQSGSFDWHHRYIGHVTEAHFLGKKPGFCAITSQKAVSCLELKNGSITWRRALDDSDAIQGSAYSEKHSLVYTLSHSAKYLRAWDVSDGQLRWEAPTGAAQHLGAALLASASQPVLYVAAGGYIQVLFA